MANRSDAKEKQPSFYGQLEDLLTEQLAAQPRNHQLRLKLLELYYETRKVDAFLREAEALAALTPDKGLSPEWQKTLSMGRMLAPHAEIFHGEPGERITFVSAAPGTSAPAQKYRRYGDEKRFTRYFDDLSRGFKEAWADPAFQAKLDLELATMARRPSSLLHAKRLSQAIGGAQIYIKREDVSPRDTHLTFSVVGQALLAQRLGKKTLVTGTTDGRRGVLTASIAARLGMDAVVFMPSETNARQSSNLFRMWLLGANVQSTVNERTGQAEEARDAALEFWARNAGDAMLITGLEGAPEPYPQITREFAATIGRECQRQLRLMARRSPDLVVARGGENADALGLFPAFLGERQTRLVCVEPAKEKDAEATSVGLAIDPAKQPLSRTENKVAQTILEGLEYPSVTREHQWLKASGRVEYLKSTLELAKKAIRDLSYYEGIIPAIKTAYALGWACQTASSLKPEQAVVVVVAEDVEKDIWDIGRLMGAPV